MPGAASEDTVATSCSSEKHKDEWWASSTCPPQPTPVKRIIKFPAAAIHSIKNQAENTVSHRVCVMCKFKATCHVPHWLCCAGQPSLKRSPRTSPNPLQHAAYSKRIISPIPWCHFKAKEALAHSEPPFLLPTPPHPLNGAAHHELAISSQVQNIPPLRQVTTGAPTHAQMLASFFGCLSGRTTVKLPTGKKQAAIWCEQRCHIKPSSICSLTPRRSCSEDFPWKWPFCRVQSVRSDYCMQPPPKTNFSSMPISQYRRSHPNQNNPHWPFSAPKNYISSIPAGFQDSPKVAWDKSEEPWVD